MEPAASAVSLERQEISRADDRDLIRRIRNHEETALTDLMSRYSAQVFSVAFQVLRTESDAQEVAQDVFWSVWRSPERFDSGRGRLLTWLVILSRSRALDLLRSLRNSQCKDLTLETLISPSDRDQVAARERTVMVDELLRRLSREQRWVIWQIYFEGLTFAETAALMAKPLGTVKNRTRFALKRLRDGLESA